MAFSEIELKKIDNLVGSMCRERIPAHIINDLELIYRINGHDVTLFEKRPDWQDPRETMETPVAKLKFVRTKKEWRLYWQRRDLKWHAYDLLSPSPDFKELVAEIDEDPYCCFFG
ncbi:MAG: DUF3024 domain-containing protein [Thermoleophilia bacterium]